MAEGKQITLTPSHKSLFWWYLLGILFIPVFGIGIYLLYRFYSAQGPIRYIITDRTITSRDNHTSAKIDIANIENVEVKKRWIDKKFGIGYLILTTPDRSLTLAGMEQPDQLAEMILTAAEAERQRIKSLKKDVKPAQENPSMSLDKLDYLTGLWQQGLLSDEDFQKEKKHFE
jgi:hypothetical protein